MTALESLVTLWLIYLGVALSPGLNFALIGQTATRHSSREALLVAAGIVTASAVWMVAALVGLAAVAERAGRVFELIRIGAALYLIVIGIQQLRSKNETSRSDDAGPGKAIWGHFSAGLLTNMGNPKSILFYGSLFAAAFPAGATPVLRAGGAALILITSIAIHAGLASLLSLDRVRTGYLRLRRPIDRVFGVVFIGFGGRLLLTDR